MAGEKVIGFEIKVLDDSISKAEIDAGKLTLALKQVTEAKKVITKAFQDGKITEETAAIATAKLTQEQKNLKTELINTGGASNSLTTTLKNFGTQFLAVTGITVGFTAALKLGKEIIGSTQVTSQAFQVTMAGVGEATQKFFQMVATGDLTNFVKNLKDAAKAGEDYKEALFEIERQKLGFTLEKSEQQYKLTELLRQARDNTNDAATRQKALNDYKTEAIKLGKEDLAISDKSIIDKENELKGIGIEATKLKELYENYNTNLETIKKTEEDLQRIREINASNSKGISDIPDVQGMENANNEIKKIYASMSDEEKHYVDLLTTNEKVKKNDLTEYINLLIDSEKKKDDIAEIDKSTQRLQNTINDETKKANLKNLDETDAREELVFQQEITRMNKLGEARHKAEEDEEIIFQKEIDAMDKRAKEKATKEEQYEKQREERQKRDAEYELKLYEENETAKINIAKSASDLLTALAGKNKDLQKTAMIAEKALAIAEVIIQTAKADAALNASAAMSASWAAAVPIPGFYNAILLAQEALVAPVIAKNKLTEAFEIASIIASTATALAGFARGGKISGGIPIRTNTRDNRLIAVNETETVLTQSQVQSLGGSAMMRKIRVPGYADGGYQGQSLPDIPAQGFDYAQLASFFHSIPVVLDINKLNIAEHELSIITSPQKI